MVARDEDALFCDFVESYHIMDFRALPPITAARLAFGLRENSRIKMSLAGAKADTETTLLAAVLDRVSWMAWAQSKDAQKGKNRPASVLSLLLGQQGEKTPEIKAFNSGEDFLAFRQKLIEGGI